ncbi:hypothetical protein U1Q18_039624 [Sarracenia purpurea var. burkii]
MTAPSLNLKPLAADERAPFPIFGGDTVDEVMKRIVFFGVHRREKGRRFGPTPVAVIWVTAARDCFCFPGTFIRIFPLILDLNRSSLHL